MEDKFLGNVDQTSDLSIKEVILRLIQWYHYLLSKWIFIIVFIVLGGIIGYIYSLRKVPVYTATTTFVLAEADEGSSLGQYAGLASMVGVDIGGSAGGLFKGSNILELYKSRRMIEKTLFTQVDYNGRKILLLDLYIEFNNLRESWKKNNKLYKLEFVEKDAISLNSKDQRLQDSIVGTIVTDINKNYLEVDKPTKDLSIIQADVRATNEIFAKLFNDQIVTNVNDFYVQTKSKKSIENIKILQRKTDSVRREMNAAIHSAVSVSDATPNLNITRQVQRQVPIQRSQYTAEANRAILGELVKNLELSKISLHKEVPLIQVIDAPVYPLKKEGLSRFKASLVGGFLGGLILVCILTVRRIIRAILV